MTSREVARVARALADQQSDARADIPRDRILFLTVAVASPLSVTWQGVSITARRSSLYTPVVGDRVACIYSDNQLVVMFKVV